MKFLITNSVPLNGGDEALLRALTISLSCRWPESNVKVLCKDLERCRKQLPDLDLASDLEFTNSTADRDTTLEYYRAADIVLSAPGGFLHDHYPVQERLNGFEVAIELGKPVVLIGQSIGPFWKSKSIKQVRKVLNQVSRICLRDEISYEHLTRCGVDTSKIRITGDAAFLWHDIAPELFRPAANGRIRTVGLSFRVWPLGDRITLRETVGKAEQLCRHILSDNEKRILFISTCQGVPGYVDDSQVAAQIRDRLPEHLQQRCEIDSSRYEPENLIRALGRCDAFIGMRLHACILAMLSGVPAMGLGYEDKTEQIFGQMGLNAYQIRFDANQQDWINTADAFFEDVHLIRDRLAPALQERCAAANQNILVVEEQLSAIPTPHTITPEQRWSSSVQRYGRPHLRLRQVAKLVNELHPQKMLDIGCATGHLRILCPGIEYSGCDFIPPSPPIEFSFHRCDFNHEPLPPELRDFDLAVCSGILEYIENPAAFLDSLRSRLNPRGHLVLTYFNMNHISRIWRMAVGYSFPVHPDWRGFHSPRDIQKLVEKSGFQIVKAIPMNHALDRAAPVEETVDAPLKLPPMRWWSPLLAHQFLFVARASGPRQPV